MPDELWTEVCDIVQETGSKTMPKKKKGNKAKWLSKEAVQISEKRREVKGKGEKERYTHLNAEFQRIASFLSLLAIFGSLHSNGYIFTFLLCLSLLFFSQLFVRLPLTTIFSFTFLLLGDVLDHYIMSGTFIYSSSGTLSIRSNPLNLFVASPV